jgi:hypothetical protein
MLRVLQVLQVRQRWRVVRLRVPVELVQTLRRRRLPVLAVLAVLAMRGCECAVAGVRW